eukprot:4137290-Pleurochrysis_carterae.AAC.2
MRRVEGRQQCLAWRKSNRCVRCFTGQFQAWPRHKTMAVMARPSCVGSSDSFIHSLKHVCPTSRG